MSQRCIFCGVLPVFSGNNLGDIIYPLCVVNARGIHFKKKKIERVKRKKKKKSSEGGPCPGAAVLPLPGCL